MASPEHNQNYQSLRHRHPQSQLVGMSAPELADESEHTGLLRGEAAGRSPGEAVPLREHRPVQGLFVDAYHASKATLRCSHANWLLGLVPLGMIASSSGWNPAAVFILNFLAIFPLAALLSYSTEELSASVGQTIGGLINATFGNAVEMIVSSSVSNATRWAFY